MTITCAGVGDAVALGDPLAQPRMPDPGAVGERPLPVVGERPLRRLPHRLGGQDVGARRAAGEADQLGGHLAPSIERSRVATTAATPPTDDSLDVDGAYARQRAQVGSTPGRGADRRYARAPIASTASWAVSVGERPTRTPRASSASFFASAVPEEPEMIAPAWPICLPGGAVKPAM